MGAPWDDPNGNPPQQGQDDQLQALKRAGGQLVQQLQQTVAQGANNGGPQGQQDRWAPPGPAQIAPPTSEAQPKTQSPLQSGVQSQPKQPKPKDFGAPAPVKPLPKQDSGGDAPPPQPQSITPTHGGGGWFQQPPQPGGSGLNGAMNQGGSGGQHLPVGILKPQPVQQQPSRWGFGQPAQQPDPAQSGGYQWRGNRAGGA